MAMIRLLLLISCLTLAACGQGEPATYSHHKHAYVASRNGQVYHDPACNSAKRIAPHNRLGFVDVREAVELGYRPCRNCLDRPASARERTRDSDRRRRR